MMLWVTVASWMASVAFIVLWLRERRESREWQIVCQCLGNEYDRLSAECRQPARVHVQESRWLN